MKTSRIYMIYSPNSKLIYVGSTTYSLSKRFSDHKYDFKRRPHKAARSSEVLKCQDAQIYLLEEFECTSKAQQLEFESRWISSLAKVNYPLGELTNKVNPLSQKKSRADNGSKIFGPEAELLISELKEALGIQDFGEDHVFTREDFEEGPICEKLLALSPLVVKICKTSPKRKVTLGELSGIGLQALGVVRIILEKCLRMKMIYSPSTHSFSFSKKE